MGPPAKLPLGKELDVGVGENRQLAGGAERRRQQRFQAIPDLHAGVLLSRLRPSNLHKADHRTPLGDSVQYASRLGTSHLTFDALPGLPDGKGSKGKCKRGSSQWGSSQWGSSRIRAGDRVEEPSLLDLYVPCRDDGAEEIREHRIQCCLRLQRQRPDDGGGYFEENAGGFTEGGEPQHG